jgi:hypothetical protein
MPVEEKVRWRKAASLNGKYKFKRRGRFLNLATLTQNLSSLDRLEFH